MKKKDIMTKKLAIFLRKKKLERFFLKQVKEDIAELVPPAKTKERAYRFYSEKILLSTAIFFTCVLVAIFAAYQERRELSILEDEEGLYVLRQSPEGEEQKIPISVLVDGQEEDGTLIVSEKKYSQEEFEKKCQDLIETLPEQIKGNNASLDAVSKDLNLQLKGIEPISYEWEMDDYQYISSNGTISIPEDATKEKLVVMTLQLSYEDYYYEHSFPIVINPQSESEETSDFAKIWKFLKEDEKTKATKDRFYLPTSWKDKEIKISEKKAMNAVKIVLLGITISLFMFYAKNRDLHKEVEKRREQLLRDYPEFVSKLMLYMGAGMTTKGAFLILEEEYRKKAAKESAEKVQFLKEELSYMVHAMENGVSEKDAYEQFGKRIKVNQYRKLMSILSQNNKKGTDNLLTILDEEAKESFDLRKTQAKRLGEKAGTKLLLPMTIMLGIVMIIIIVPAFLSYDI